MYLPATTTLPTLLYLSLPFSLSLSWTMGRDGAGLGWAGWARHRLGGSHAVGRRDRIRWDWDQSVLCLYLGFFARRADVARLLYGRSNRIDDLYGVAVSDEGKVLRYVETMWWIVCRVYD